MLETTNRRIVASCLSLLISTFIISCGPNLDVELSDLTDFANDIDNAGLDGRGDNSLIDESPDSSNDPSGSNDDPTTITYPQKPDIGKDEPPRNFDPDDDEIECGDGDVTGAEECDDDNTESGDGCSATCTDECGDGVHDVDNSDGYVEECDDGNVVNGDGCSATCTSEATVLAGPRTTFDMGHEHVCLIDDVSRQLKCWGLNDQGQLGQGNVANIGDGVGATLAASDAIDVGTGLSAALVVAGGDSVSASTCVITNTNDTKCFGDNGSGQLGKGNSLDLGDEAGEMGDDLSAIDLGTARFAVDLDSGSWHQCAILDDDTVKCWGTNINGELGIGTTANMGFSVGTMGNNLPAVDLGTGRTADSIATGGNHSCAILDDTTLKCWGRNALGQLGQGSTTNLGDAGGEMGDALVAIDLGTGRSATQVSAGSSHTCALLDDGSVKCWGWGSSGVLGQGTTDNLGDAALEMGDNLLAIDLGTGRTATQIASGRLHNCALLDDDTVKCWGNNSYGQLGQESTGHLGDGGGEMGDALLAIDLGTGRTALAIAAGGLSTCALLDNGDLKCWGYNSEGQLAQDSTANIGDAVSEMGDDLDAIVTGF